MNGVAVNIVKFLAQPRDKHGGKKKPLFLAQERCRRLQGPSKETKLGTVFVGLVNRWRLYELTGHPIGRGTGGLFDT